MNQKYINFRRRSLIMAAYYDVKLIGKISQVTQQIAKQLKKDQLNAHLFVPNQKGSSM